MSDASPVFEARDPDSFSWSGRPGRDERVAGALVGLALLLTFREQGVWALALGAIALAMLLKRTFGSARSLRVDESGLSRQARGWPPLLPWSVIKEVLWDPRQQRVMVLGMHPVRALVLRLTGYGVQTRAQAVQAIALQAGERFRERVDGSLPTGEDRTPWPAGTILWTSRSSILPTVLVAGCFAWFARRPTAWAGLLLALVFALTLLLRATARVRVKTDGLDVWRATSIRPLRVAWDQIAGLEGGEATPLTIRRHRVGPVRSRVRLLPGHFTRLQATLQLHGTEAVFA